MNIELAAKERQMLLQKISQDLDRILDLMMDEKTTEAAVQLERTRHFIYRRREEIHRDAIGLNDYDE